MHLGWHMYEFWRDPWALTTGLPVRLLAACAVVAVIWAVVLWAW